jgi:hypothetical protein
MSLLTKSDLWSLEQYSEQRADFREQVLRHKKNRKLMVGNHMQLIFEDRLTIQYQVQEMLRIEKIFEADGIQEELDTYNPLIPNGTNWKATFMLEYDDIDQRKVALENLIGVEDQVWMQVGDSEKVYAIADEDLERENDVKTSSVHFLRFELSQEMLASAKSGSKISAGCDHPELAVKDLSLNPETSAALTADLQN